MGDLELLWRGERDRLSTLCVIVHVCLADESLDKSYSSVIQAVGFCASLRAHSGLGSIRILGRISTATFR
jgi:hypothetical protein